MSVPFAHSAFSRGEIAPALWGRTDWQGWGSAASTLRNMFVDYRGGARSRAGTAFVGYSMQRADLGDHPPKLINFQFNLSQGYCLEFGEKYLRFVYNGGFIVEATKAITGATQANPCSITAVAHGYTSGDWVQINNVLGMTALNSNTYRVVVTGANTFTLQTHQSVAINSTAYGAYISGGTAARVYTVTTPYAAADLPLLKYTQSADVMSLTHPNYAPQELKRLAQTNWTLTPAAFASTTSAPASCSASANVHPNGALTPPTLPCAYAYVVTKVDATTGQESEPSPRADVTNSVDMDITAGSITVSWGAVTGDGYYKVYRSAPSYNTNTGSATNAYDVPAGALFGFVARSYGTTFVDSNATLPDFGEPPPTHRDPTAPGQILGVTISASSADWPAGSTTATITTATGSGFVGEVVVDSFTTGHIVAVIIKSPGKLYLAGDTISFGGGGSSATAALTIGPASGTYPGLVTYFQQRRVYAASTSAPDTFWASKPGEFLNFDSAIPTVDSDAITATPWAQQVNGIQWMLPMPLGLLTFTGGGVEQVGPSGSSASNPTAITPANVLAVPQSSIGSHDNVPPVKINWNILYLGAKGNTVWELSYQLVFNIYTGVDVSWQSSHLFTDFQIDGWAWCEEPLRVLWAFRDDGPLLSLTYVKAQEVNGWARHDTQGQIVAMCSVVEAPSAVTQATRGGVDALYLGVERFKQDGGDSYFIERMDNRLWQSVEDAWAVDCGVATTLTAPAATLSASAASGVGVVLNSAPGVWTGGDVGKIIRSGGGIAVITAYSSASQVTGTWLSPCQQIIPNDPNGTVLPQVSGAWSLAPQVTTVSGLAHLAGRVVTGLADGVPVTNRTVSSTGTVTLDNAASKIVLGLGYIAQVQSDYADFGTPTIQGRRKNIPAVTLRLEASCPTGLQVGANQADASAQPVPPAFSPWSGLGAPTPQGATFPATYATASGVGVQPLYTGDARVVIPANWKKPGQVAAQQVLPLAFNLLAFIPEMLPGDLPESGFEAKQQGGQPRPAAPAKAGMSEAETMFAAARFSGG